MTEQTNPSVPEKIATHKPVIQKWLIGVGGGVFVILAFMLVATIWTNVEKQKQPPTPPPVADKNVEQPNTAPATERFFNQVDNRVKANDNQKQRDAAAQGRSIAPSASGDPQQPSTQLADPATNPGVARLQAARERLNNQANAETAGKGNQPSPDDQFKTEERIRALRSRATRSELIIADNSQQRAGSAAGRSANLGSLAEPLKQQPTIEERKEEVRQKLEEVRRYRESIENGTLNPSNATNEKTQPVNVRETMAKRISNNSTNSASKSIGTDIVGMTRANIEADNRDTTGLTLLPTGTVLNGALSMTTMSDYLGTIKGIITQDVYDINYEIILIPKGSQILIKTVTASNINLPIQARMGLTVPWIILPNGKRIDFSRTAALDHMGIGAIKDKVNYHFMAQFLGVAAYAVLASETESPQSSDFTGQTNIQGDINSEIRKQFAPLAARYLTLVPTITLRSGTPFKIIIEDDIYLKPWGNVYEKLYSNN